MKDFKPGWYRVYPYFNAHFFHGEFKSVCGIIANRNFLTKPKAMDGRCHFCQNGTGGK